MAKEKRVQRFIDLMLDGSYVDGRSPQDEAKRMGISVNEAQRNASEASRYIRRACGSPEDIKSRLLVQLELIAKRTKDKRPRAAVAAIREIGTILGLRRQAVELTGPDGAPLIPGVVVLPPRDDEPQPTTSGPTDHLEPAPGSTE